MATGIAGRRTVATSLPALVFLDRCRFAAGASELTWPSGNDLWNESFARRGAQAAADGLMDAVFRGPLELGASKFCSRNLITRAAYSAGASKIASPCPSPGTIQRSPRLPAAVLMASASEVETILSP